MTSMLLSKTLIDKMKCLPGSAKGYDIFWDSTIKGFGVRVTDKGTKAFVLRFTYEGKRRVHTIGQYGVFTLDEARRIAASALQRLALGENPFAQKKAFLTVEEFCRRYIKDHCSRLKTGDKDRFRIEKYIIPEWGELDLRDLSRGLVSTKHASMSDVPYEANRLLALISSLWNRAIDWGVLADEFETKNPAKRIKRYSEETRDRFVTANEMPKFLEAIDAYPDPFIRAAFFLYLLTGLRKEELMSLSWDFVDLQAGQLKLPDSKAGRAHYLPLPQAAVAILKDLPRQLGSRFVFPGSKPKQHMKLLPRHWTAIREASGMKDLRIHDLRRTVGSWMAQDGASLPLIGKVLNHSNVSTTQVYARFHSDPVREALEKLSSQIFKGRQDGGSLEKSSS